LLVTDRSPSAGLERPDVIRVPFRCTALAACLVLAACGNEPNPPGGLECSGATTSLAVGEFQIVDATQTACVRLPAAGGSEVEHLLVALSANGTETLAGITAGYKLQAGSGGITASAARSPAALDYAPSAAQAFHDMLRARERDLSHQPALIGASRQRLARSVVAVPPTVGQQRTFEVCANTSCTDFTTSTATAKVVGQRVAIFLDDAAPVGYTQADLNTVGDLFDNHLYPIDTTAFGRESDLDGNGVVIVLLTQRVNELSPNCTAEGSVILGFFYGGDLLPQQHSNDGEIFYGLVPGTATPGCTVDKNFATQTLPGVFIHEFQHMISFNQHVLLRQGTSEDTWLNEGLSHFAEELGGENVPDAFCPGFNNCESQFNGNNIENAFSYLDDPESNFLIEPGSSTGTLAERGANWLFVRWLADHFAASPAQPADLTRKLVDTDLVGGANVAAAAGDDFPTLVSQWQMANYLEGLDGFTGVSPRLTYVTNLRAIFLLNFNNGVFDKPYPLTPDVTSDGAYSRTGVLRGGSGRHVRVIQPASSGAVSLQLTNSAGSDFVDAKAAPRIALVRIR
jgi:hypothetical protein